MKKSIPSAERFSEISPKIAELNAEKKKVWNELNKVRDQEAAAKKKVDTIKSTLDANRSEKEGIGKQLDALQEDIDKIDKEIDAHYDSKREHYESFWKAKYNHKLQRMEINHIEWMERNKQKVLDFEAEKADMSA